MADDLYDDDNSYGMDEDDYFGGSEEEDKVDFDDVD